MPRSSHRTRLASRRYQLMRKFGLTLEQYDQILASQGGVCACCGSSDPNRAGRYGTHPGSFRVDHEHGGSRLIRGLLCHKCNVGIGALGDTAEGVARALAYLQRHAMRLAGFAPAT